jgi:hypothetical protein
MACSNDAPAGFQNKASLFEASAAIAETFRVKINRRRKSERRWCSWECQCKAA